MHISEIYLQSNFQSDPVGNPFLYNHIGIRVSLNAGENLEEAENTAKEYINNYINKNTQYPEHAHIEVRDLPEIQKEEGGESLEDLISNAPDDKTLLSFQFLAKGNAQLYAAFLQRTKELEINI